MSLEARINTISNGARVGFSLQDGRRGMMTNKLTFGRIFFFLLIPAFTTGMGNGSVFGAAEMCAVGRGSYGSWGGWHWEAYNPGTFSGFVVWLLFFFGFVFVFFFLLVLFLLGFF